MTVDVKVPTLPESVPDATVLQWRKAVGDAVEQDEILVELETDKVVLEVPAPQAGVLIEIAKNDGDLAVADEILARIDTTAVAAKSTADSTPSAAAPSASGAAAPPAPAAAAAVDVALSPAVRKLVEEHDLNPVQIAATGKGGRITKGDVLAHLETPPQAPPPAPSAAAPAPPAAVEPTARSSTAPDAARSSRREPMSRLRQRIAQRLVSAQHTAAILTTFNEINMQPVLELRNRHKERFEKVHGVRLGFMSFLNRSVSFKISAIN